VSAPPFGIAVAGSGDMGGTYAEVAARHLEGAGLVAISGGTRAPGLARDYGVDHVERFEDLLAREDVDGVVLALPHSLHRDSAVAAAEGRKHVLVEKPMALSVAECDEMLAAAQRAGVDLSVIMTMRFDDNFRAARRLVDDGTIGEVRMLRMSGLTPGYDMGHKTWLADAGEGGVLLDWGSHAFDICRWFAGADPVRLSAELATFGPATVPEPSAMVQVAYANGALAQVWMSYELPAAGLESPFRLAIVGSAGVLEVERFGRTLLTRDGGTVVAHEEPAADWSLERRHDPVRLRSPIRQLQAWVDAIRTGSPSVASGADARWAVLQVEAAYRSWREGVVVRLS
jgi:myo-inositol 2-dehydrogenase/D-chiro-inositol 1-dehydrogenase